MSVYVITVDGKEQEVSTSPFLDEYTIEVKRVEKGIYQAQLKELPGVITTAKYWVSIPALLQDALDLYVLSEVSE